jgi:hypothetical protein
MNTDKVLALAREAGYSTQIDVRNGIHTENIWGGELETAKVMRFAALIQREMEAENAELRNDAEIGSAIRMAAKDLPENFELEITVERGAASVYLRTPDEETVCIDVDSDNRLAAEIRNGIDRARSANERI